MIRNFRLFVRGALAPFTGLNLIVRHRSLIRLAALPFFVGLIIFVVGFAVGLPFVTSLVSPFSREFIYIFGIKETSTAGAWLLWFLPLFLWPALALMLIYLLLNLTRLIAAPLYGYLAARVLLLNGVRTVGGAGLREAASKTAVLLVMGLALGVLSFIPGVAIFTGPLFLVLLAYDVFDYSLEILGWKMNRRLAFFRSHFSVFLGLGTCLGLLFLVPGLGFFVLPSAVAGAADLIAKDERFE